MSLNEYIDHTLLKATATESDIATLCSEATQYDFYAVCVNSCFVPLAKKQLQNSSVKVASVIGFPLGAMATESKIAEATYCIEHGADEIDMVLNLGWLKAGQTEKVTAEIKEIKGAIKEKVLKVIIETCYLSPEEIRLASELVMKGGADFVKTSTGFGTAGATFEAVSLMKEVVGNAVRIKASGGIRDKETALKYIELGVSRIGTSSGIAMMNP